MINNITFSHFEGLHKQGYSLDVVFLLTLAKQGVDVKSLCEGSPKLEVLFQGVFRKGLITDQCKLTLSGQSVLDFLQQEISETTPLKKKTNIDSEFERWWKAYPGTDTFVHKGKTFLDEGEYTIDEMLEALEYEVLQKKENSVKAGENKLKYMQNTLTYLNQRTFEPYIELIKEGVSAPTEEHSVPSGSLDI